MGRAGNLLFQLGGISAAKRRPSERLILLNFLKLRKFFPTLDRHATLLEVPPEWGTALSRLEQILKFLAKLRIVGAITETYPDSTVLQRNRGIIPLTFFWGGWCQSERTLAVGLLNQLWREASQVSGDRTERKIDQKVCFVHVRRGDYLNFPSSEYSAALPSTWYREQMQQISAYYPGINFRIFSDDLAYAKREFSEVADSEVVDCSDVEAFFEMGNCDAGILSPSTFSWWAAYFAHSQKRGLFIAPHFWAGWRLGLWHPYSQIESTFLKYEKVNL